VAVESRFITIRSGYLSQIGVDLDVIFNIGSPIYGPDATGVGSTVDPYTGGTVPYSNNQSSWNQYGANASQQWNNMSPVGMINNSMQQVSQLGSTTIVPNGVGSWANSAAMTVAGTFMDDIQVDFMIEATEADSSSRTMTAPRLTLLNGQRAYVSVAINQAYVAGFDPIVSEGAVGVDPIISYGPTGTLLDVDATVNHDRRYVTMTLRPQVVRFEVGEPIIVPAGIAIPVPVFLPTVTLQEVMTTVSVPDGGTLLLGGQRLGDQREREMGVPFVSKIPVVNRAFTNKSLIKDEESLIILVKPSIIIP
jgi:Flp pilus assembly secretin CpaC